MSDADETVGDVGGEVADFPLLMVPLKASVAEVSRKGGVEVVFMAAEERLDGIVLDDSSP